MYTLNCLYNVYYLGHPCHLPWAISTPCLLLPSVTISWFPTFSPSQYLYCNLDFFISSLHGAFGGNWKLPFIIWPGQQPWTMPKEANCSFNFSPACMQNQYHKDRSNKFYCHLRIKLGPADSQFYLLLVSSSLTLWKCFPKQLFGGKGIYFSSIPVWVLNF